jgi:hypothetical protein
MLALPDTYRDGAYLAPRRLPAWVRLSRMIILIIYTPGVKKRVKSEE